MALNWVTQYNELTDKLDIFETVDFDGYLKLLRVQLFQNNQDGLTSMSQNAVVTQSTKISVQIIQNFIKFMNEMALSCHLDSKLKNYMAFTEIETVYTQIIQVLESSLIERGKG